MSHYYKVTNSGISYYVDCEIIREIKANYEIEFYDYLTNKTERRIVLKTEVKENAEREYQWNPSES